MPLVPKQEQADEGPKTRAGKLRAMHAAISNRDSKYADFSGLLKRFSYEDIERTLRWMEKQPEHIRRTPSYEFRINFQFFRNQCDQDMSDYPTTQEAEDLHERIHQESGVEPISTNYIQHALDRYRDLTQWMKDCDLPCSQELLEKMLPAKEFVFVWFTRIVPSFSKKFRKFHTSHPKFQQMQLMLSKEIGPTKAWITLSNEYDQWTEKHSSKSTV